MFSEKDRLRFEKYFKKSFDPDACWIWEGKTDKSNYGRFYCNKKQYRAHRFSYELYNQIDPAGMFICHKCDNPSCVNPEHLWIGTHTDNMRDKSLKDRTNLRNTHEGSKKKWEDPIYREKMRKISSERLKEKWKNPIYREKMSQLLTRKHTQEHIQKRVISLNKTLEKKFRNN